MSQEQEFHILEIHDRLGNRTYHLTAATYSIGRDASSNGIPISDSAASRHHAMLLRMPTQGNHYVYQLIDGDLTGKRSTNGLIVNGKRCFERTLKTGDRISIGQTVKMSYMIANMTPSEFAKFFQAESPSFHTLKKESLDATGTLMNINPNK